MKIQNTEDATIESLDDWARIYDTPRSARHWKQHRSAYSIAEFIMNRQGAQELKSRVADVVGEKVEFERAIPEHEIRFDSFGHGRMHDLGIYGRTASGKSLFVGVEAKVDEPFGALVRDVYLEAKARQIAGESTNAPERIENLLKMHFDKPDQAMFGIRYQLLYATAGTLAAGADISVLYVVVFRTPLYSETTSAENYRDYVDFLSKTGASHVKLPGKEAHVHRLFLRGKELLCIHEHFDL